MCGRFVSSTPPDQLAAYFDVDEVSERLLDRGPNFNTAPTTAVYVVHRDGAARRLDSFRWGLVPSWAKDVNVGNRMINARAETVAEKPAYRAAFRRRRCIIPADGFFEWTAPTAASGSKKQPWFIHRPDGEPYAFAGLWEHWNGPAPPQEAATPAASDPTAHAGAGAAPLRSCAIVTTSANQPMSQLHDRMPVILPPAAWDAWLDPDEEDLDLLGSFLVPAASELISFHPVGTEVNNARNQGEHLIDPVDPEG